MRTPVTVWDISEEDEKVLDRYEGFPSLYRKENLTLYLDGEELTAMVYIINLKQINIPSYSYYKCIEQGYKDAGFDTDILRSFLERTYEQLGKNKLLASYGTYPSDKNDLPNNNKPYEKRFISGVA